MSDKSDAGGDNASNILSDATILAGTTLATLQLIAIPSCNGERDVGDWGGDFEGYHEQCISMMIDLISKIARASKKIQDEQCEHDKAFRKYKKAVEMLRKLRDENLALRKNYESLQKQKRDDNSEPFRKIAALELSRKTDRMELESLQSTVNEYMNAKEVKILKCLLFHFFHEIFRTQMILIN